MAACPNCQAPFWLPPSYARRGVRYCSVACRKVAHWETRACARCATSYDTLKSSRRRFCSRACSSAAKKSATVDPCVRCGTLGGIITARCVTPVRRRGEPFGYDGRLCGRCHGRFAQAKRRAAARQRA